MEIRTLRNFAAVVRAGNVTRAAAALRISQPALSMQLRELEEELGGPLLVRHARGVEPTDRGARLLRRADDIVALADRTREEVRAEGSGGLTGTLAIGAGETPAFAAVARATPNLYMIIVRLGNERRERYFPARISAQSSSAISRYRLAVLLPKLLMRNGLYHMNRR